MTYDELRLRIIRAAQNLQKRGYVRGQVFTTVAKNAHHLAPIVFGSLGIGCSMSTLEPTYGKAELLHMLNIIQPSLLFCDVDKFDLVKECLIELGNNAHVFTFGGSHNGSENVDNLFAETHTECRFV